MVYRPDTAQTRVEHFPRSGRGKPLFGSLTASSPVLKVKLHSERGVTRRQNLTLSEATPCPHRVDGFYVSRIANFEKQIGKFSKNVAFGETGNSEIRAREGPSQE